jgi:hypothetical protein
MIENIASFVSDLKVGARSLARSKGLTVAVKRPWPSEPFPILSPTGQSIILESQRIFRLVQASPGHCSEPRSWLIDMRRIEGVAPDASRAANVAEAWVRRIIRPET